MNTTIETLSDLARADAGSFYTIAGVGGDPQEWVDGYNDLLAKAGIGTPAAWYATTGAAVNRYAEHKARGFLVDRDAFPDDITFLLFPLDGLNVARLPVFKIQMQDRWFDDIIANMATEAVGS